MNAPRIMHNVDVKLAVSMRDIDDAEKYLPAYGGFCAYGIGHDSKRFNVNPKAFKIIDGKNYLFWRRFIYDSMKRWDKDEKHLKKNAERNWKKLLDKE